MSNDRSDDFIVQDDRSKRKSQSYDPNSTPGSVKDSDVMDSSLLDINPR